LIVVIVVVLNKGTLIMLQTIALLKKNDF